MTVGAARAHHRRFCDVSELRQAGPGRFDAAADPEWTIGGKPNGGVDERSRSRHRSERALSAFP
jgi:hypothetical protein